MKHIDIFQSWAERTSIPHLQDIDKAGLDFWGSKSRWPLLAAIQLSMGLNPHAKQKHSGKMIGPAPTDAEIEQGNEFAKRVKLAFMASEDGSLMVDMVAANIGNAGPAVDREVDAKTFIKWAKDSFDWNADELFEQVLKSYKSTAHAASGAHKGDAANDIKDLITAKAIAELDAGCRCHHSELAEYLEHLKRRDGSARFQIPINQKNKPSLKSSRWSAHVLDATVKAFRAKDIPLRNEPKTELRGRDWCELHRSWRPPTNLYR